MLPSSPLPATQHTAHVKNILARWVVFCPRPLLARESLTNQLEPTVASQLLLLDCWTLLLFPQVCQNQRRLMRFDMMLCVISVRVCDELSVWQILVILRAFWCIKYSEGNWQHCITIATPFMWDASATYSTLTNLMGSLHHLMACNPHDSVCRCGAVLDIEIIFSPLSSSVLIVFVERGRNHVSAEKQKPLTADPREIKQKAKRRLKSQRNHVHEPTVLWSQMCLPVTSFYTYRLVSWHVGGFLS